MKLLLRILLIAVIGGLLVYALHAYCYMPLHCNMIEKKEEARSLRAYNSMGTATATILARTSLDALRPCAEVCSTNPNYYMIKAADLQALGDTSAAVQQYQIALRYDRRPEIYLNLGLTLLELGDRRAAEQALVTGGIFNPQIVDDIPYEDVQSSVRRQVLATFARWAAEHPARQ